MIAAPGVAPVSAQENAVTMEEAKQHWERGAKAYDAGDFEEAYREFEAGYRATPRPGFLLNMAHAQRRMGNLRKARELYHRYLLIEPDSPGGEGVQQLINDLDQAIAVENRDNPDAGSGRQSPIEPLIGDGGSPSRDGGTAITPLPAPKPNTAAAITAPGATPVPTRPFYRRWWFWTGVATVAAVAATGITLGIMASRPDFVSAGTIGTLGPQR